jgi:hypothetical protein
MGSLRRGRVVLGALLVTLVLLGEAGLAEASGRTRAPSLKVDVPASMARGSVLIVKATGYSGPYNTVSWSSVRGGSSACGPPGPDTITLQAVPMKHTFSVKLTNVFGGPGAMTVCVYLFTGGPHPGYAKGHYIVKRNRVEVS